MFTCTNHCTVADPGGGGGGGGPLFFAKYFKKSSKLPEIYPKNLGQAPNRPAPGAPLLQILDQTHQYRPTYQYHIICLLMLQGRRLGGGGVGGHRRSARPTSRPRSGHRLVKSKILSRSSPPPLFRQKKSPLNWMKCTQKILGASPQNHVRPLSSYPGLATDTATPRGRNCHSPNTLNTLSPQGGYIGPIYVPSTACTLIQAGERRRFRENHILEKGWGIFWEGGVDFGRAG